jgi:hypothetical protein
MKLRLLLSCALALLLSLSIFSMTSFAATSHAWTGHPSFRMTGLHTSSPSTIKPSVCPSPLSYTTQTATGTTTASVAVTLWQACDGKIYAISQSTANSTGFFFKGIVAVVDIYGNYYTTSCSTTAQCISPAIPASITYSSYFETNNGVFYYLNGSYIPGGFTYFGGYY